MVAKKKKIGRPLLDIDETLLRDLARIHCTMEEMASILRCSVDTLENRFSDIIKEEKDNGKSSLRRTQYKLALAGNVGMLIWLGKIVLGQREPDRELHSDTKELTITVHPSRISDESHTHKDL